MSADDCKEYIWITNETPARALFVRGRSALDPDCLVAYAEGDTKPLWIIACQTRTEAAVCGLGKGVRARRIMRPESASPNKTNE